VAFWRIIGHEGEPYDECKAGLVRLGCRRHWRDAGVRCVGDSAGTCIHGVVDSQRFGIGCFIGSVRGLVGCLAPATIPGVDETTDGDRAATDASLNLRRSRRLSRRLRSPRERRQA
jgi:hypothetical protein